MSDPRPVTVVDCGHGNLASVANGLLALGVSSTISADPDEVSRARVLLFPGQGAAPAAMASLRRTGLDDALTSALTSGASLLGICLGMQVLLHSSEEGPVPTLSLIGGEVRRFESRPGSLKVPQIGWNEVRHHGHPLFAGIPSHSHFYFVHSYYCVPTPQSTIGWTEYGTEYCSAVQSDNVWGVQFHPEKSGQAGLQLLHNFIRAASC